MKRSVAIFDFDGTLVDGQASICAAMDRAFAELGLPSPDRAEVRRMVGLSLVIGLRRLLPWHDEAMHHRVAEAYKTAFRNAREAGERSDPMFDGMRDLLEGLRGNGWSLGVATGKSMRGLAYCLAEHGITDHFGTLQTSDHHPSKPHPAMLEAAMAELLAAPEECVMIGDTAYDIEMANAAGVHAIGVGWGYHTPSELLHAGADFVAASPAELAEYLRQ